MRRHYYVKKLSTEFLKSGGDFKYLRNLGLERFDCVQSITVNGV